MAPIPLDLGTCRTEEPPAKPPTPASPAKQPPPARPSAPVPPAPVAQQQVLGQSQRPVRGHARFGGPSGCVPRPFSAVVRGRQIRRVTFFLDGRRIAVRVARRGQGRFAVRIRPAGLRPGVHRVTARVAFRAASRTRARTLVLSFQRCVRRAPAPRFTG